VSRLCTDLPGELTALPEPLAVKRKQECAFERGTTKWRRGKIKKNGFCNAPAVKMPAIQM